MMKCNSCATLLLLCCLPFIACQKDGDNNPNPNKTSLLTASVWKYSTAGLDLDKNGTKDNDLPPGYIVSCDTDNTVSFKSDGSGIVDEGATKCDANKPQSYPFSWSFKNNESDINFSTPVFSVFTGDAKVIELTSTKLTLSKDITITGLPGTYTVIVSLVH